MDHVVRVADLTVSYGDLRAVDTVSLDVAPGEIMGIAGPNGAGKTTLVECVAGLRPPTGGRVIVFGRPPDQVRHRIGVQLQESSFPSRTRVAELCRLFAALYRHPAPAAALLDAFGLAAKRDALVSELSGGQRQRLALVLALIGRPDLVILDELTTGLDPAARREAWRHIARLREDGVTVLLTSHYMDELEHLADRLVLLTAGQVRAHGSVADVIREHGRALHEYILDGATRVPPLDGVREVRVAGGRTVILGEHPRALESLRRHLGPDVDVEHRGPSLEDVVLSIADGAS